MKMNCLRAIQFCVCVKRANSANRARHAPRPREAFVHTQRMLVHNDNGYLPKLDFITVCTLHKIKLIDKCLR